MFQVAWKSFWERHQKYRTICMACITRRNLDKRDEAVAAAALGGAEVPTGPQFGPVFLTAASKAIMIKWCVVPRVSVCVGGGGGCGWP